MPAGQRGSGAGLPPLRGCLKRCDAGCLSACCSPQVLVAVGETVWVIDDDGATDQALPAGCGGVASMAVSPSGAFLAVACLDGKLRVMQSGEQHLAEEPAACQHASNAG